MMVRRYPNYRGWRGHLFWGLACKLGIHSDYKYDGEWVGMCAYCSIGHPRKFGEV